MSMWKGEECECERESGRCVEGRMGVDVGEGCACGREVGVGGRVGVGGSGRMCGRKMMWMWLWKRLIGEGVGVDASVRDNLLDRQYAAI